MAGDVLADARSGKNGRHVFGRLAGYEDVNDAERLRHDPAMRSIVGGKATSGCAASPSQMGRFETQWLAAEKNLSALADLSGRWINAVHGRRPPKGVVLDMDSSVSPTHGEQENSAWNGHYACTCYHPLFVFNQFGDLERCALRPGNVHSADGWEVVLKPVVERYQGKISRIIFSSRCSLRDARGLRVPRGGADQIRDPASGQPGSTGQDWLPAQCAPSGGLRTRCAGFMPTSPIRLEAGPSRAPGDRKSRVASGRALSARRLHRHQPVASGRQGRRLLRQARHMRTMDQGRQRRDQVTRLSCRMFAANAVRLQLHALAYNLGSFLRTLATPEP